MEELQWRFSGKMKMGEIPGSNVVAGEETLKEGVKVKQSTYNIIVLPGETQPLDVALLS